MTCRCPIPPRATGRAGLNDKKKLAKKVGDASSPFTSSPTFTLLLRLNLRLSVHYHVALFVT